MNLQKSKIAVSAEQSLFYNIWNQENQNINSYPSII